jgi:hypothetical protein
MKRKLKIFLCCAFAGLMLSSCAAFLDAFTPPAFSGSNMSKLELGMTKDEVIKIMGRDFSIIEKRMENGSEIEVFSYTNLNKQTSEIPEFFLFRFNNGKLEEMYREFPKRPETIIIKQE